MQKYTMQKQTMQKHTITALICLAGALIIAALSGSSFLSMRKPDVIVHGPGVTEVKMLSDWFPGIKNTAGDTEVYVMKGQDDGTSMLVLGGTHPNEPAGHMAAIVLIENVVPKMGDFVCHSTG